LEPQTAYRLSARVGPERLVLSYLSPYDEPWLEALLAECARFVGRKQAELQERLREPLGVPAPRSKLRVAAQVLERLLPENPQRSPLPREVRARVFAAAAHTFVSRQQVLAGVARELSVDVPTLELALFADLAGQRRIAALPPDLSAGRLALLANQALVHTFLKRALRVRIKAWGSAHTLVKQARRLGLICLVSTLAGPSPHGEPGVVLDISGPFALFRKTELYGRALASLLPHAARCQHFELEAACALGRGAPLATLGVSPSDPIFAATEPSAFDSRVETRLRRELERLKANWRWVLEPSPVASPEGLHFPDVELVHASDPERRWQLEIVGFWTPEYLRQRLAATSGAGLRFILCVDEARRCSEQDFPADPRVFRYKTRIDVKRLLAHFGLYSEA
jgi:uncharacterized protein